VLRHPILIAAARAEREGQCYRETPVTYRLESGVIVEGYVDLAYRDGDSIVVVDFKTDRELDGTLERYRRQVSIYATAVGRTAGLPTQAFLMRV
jgi:ATP-dependent exoDNAse (exonuclease V) beta subunit